MLFRPRQVKFETCCKFCAVLAFGRTWPCRWKKVCWIWFWAQDIEGIGSEDIETWIFFLPFLLPFSEARTLREKFNKIGVEFLGFGRLAFPAISKRYPRWCFLRTQASKGQAGKWHHWPVLSKHSDVEAEGWSQMGAKEPRKFLKSQVAVVSSLCEF